MDSRIFYALLLIPILITGCGGGGGGSDAPSNTGNTSTNNTNANTTTTDNTSSSAVQAIPLPAVQLSGRYISLQLNASAPVARRASAKFAATQKATASASGVLIIDGGTWKPVCAINAGVQSSGDTISVDQACLSDMTVIEASGVNINESNTTGTMHLIAARDQFLQGNLAVTPLTEIAYSDVHLALAAGKSSTEIFSKLDGLSKQFFRNDINGDGVFDYRDVLAWRPAAVSSLRIDLTPLYDAYSSGGDVGIVAAQLATAATLGPIPAGDNTDPISSDNQVTSLLAINNVIYTATSDLNTPQVGNDSDIPDTSGWLHASTTNGDALWRAVVGSRVKIRAANANYLVAVKDNPEIPNPNKVKPEDPDTICPLINNSIQKPPCRSDNELLVAQIPSSSAPQIIRLPLTVSIDDVALNGSEAILATSAGLFVIDLTNVADSAISVSVDSPQFPKTASFAATGDLITYGNGKIYLASQQSLTIFSLTDSGITQLGQLNLTDNSNIFVSRIVVSGTHLYIAGGIAGILNIDISNPASPILINRFYEGSSMMSSAATYDVFPTDNSLISLGDNSGLRTLTLDSNGNLQPVGRLFVKNIRGTARGGMLNNELFYITDDNELRRSDIGGFAGDQWRIAATAIPGAKGRTLTMNGTTAYVGSSPDDSSAEIVALDISNPNAMTVQREYPVGGFVSDMILHGSTAAIANSTWGYETLDLQSGAVNQFALNNTGSTSVGLTSFGSVDLLFDRSGYAVYDASNPASPVFKGVYDRSIDPNCGNKEHPGSCDVPDSWSGLVLDSTLYEAGGEYGLSVVSLNADSSPGTSARILTSDGAGWQGLLNAFSMTKDGNQLYVAGGCAAGLSVLDITTVASPRVLANTQGADCPWQVVINNHVAYVMDMDAGISVYDVAQPNNPIYIGSMPTQGPATKGWANGTAIFAVDQRALNTFPLVRYLAPGTVK